jgi:hypothetical protein
VKELADRIRKITATYFCKKPVVLDLLLSTAGKQLAALAQVKRFLYRGSGQL